MELFNRVFIQGQGQQNWLRAGLDQPMDSICSWNDTCFYEPNCFVGNEEIWAVNTLASGKTPKFSFGEY